MCSGFQAGPSYEDIRSTAKWDENLPSLPGSGESSCVVHGTCVWVSDLLSNSYFAALLAVRLWANYWCLSGLVAFSEWLRGAVVQLMVKSSGSRVRLACGSGSMTYSCVTSKLQFSLLSDGDNWAHRGHHGCPQQMAGGKHLAQPQAYGRCSAEVSSS